jgi:hypothetical protein
MVRAVGLISGGLDSLLAVKLLQEQGIEVIGVAFKSPFFDVKKAKEAASRLGIPLRVIDITEDLIPIIRAPKHGYGSGMNPCIDCHTLMVKKAGEVMKEVGAQFVFTGEVLGQRPFSQTKRAMRTVEEESGMVGLVLRPLSAKKLPPTIPEKEGWVKREGLLGLWGRGRKEQMELAWRLGINDPPQPAGGCLLTDPAFSRRVKDLLDHQESLGKRDLELLKIGRHFRLSPTTKLIVGRKEGENAKLRGLSTKEDLLLELQNLAGPIGLIPYGGREADLPLACGIYLRYARMPSGHLCKVKFSGKWEGALETFPLPPEECEKYLI